MSYHSAVVENSKPSCIDVQGQGPGQVASKIGTGRLFPKSGTYFVHFLSIPILNRGKYLCCDIFSYFQLKLQDLFRLFRMRLSMLAESSYGQINVHAKARLLLQQGNGSS